MTQADPQHFRELKKHARPDILLRLTRDTESGNVFIGSSDAQIYQVDPLAESPDFKPFSGAGHTSYIMGIVDTGKYLVSGSYDKSLIWWDKQTLQVVRKIEKAHDRWIRNLTLSPDGKTVLSVADDMLCKIWNSRSGKLIRTLASHQKITPHHFPNMLYAVAVSPDGRFIATVDRIAKIKIWNSATGKEIKELEAPQCYTWDPKARIHSIGGIRSVTFSPDSKTVAVGGIGQIGNIDHLGAAGRVELFSVESGEKIHMFEGDDKHKGLVEQIVFHPSGKWLMAVGGDHAGWVQFMDLEKNEVIKQEKAPMHVHQVAVTEDFSTVYAVGHANVCVWSLLPEAKEETAPDK